MGARHAIEVTQRWGIVYLLFLFCMVICVIWHTALVVSYDTPRRLLKKSRVVGGVHPLVYSMKQRHQYYLYCYILEYPHPLPNHPTQLSMYICKPPTRHGLVKYVSKKSTPFIRVYMNSTFSENNTFIRIRNFWIIVSLVSSVLSKWRKNTTYKHGINKTFIQHQQVLFVVE